MAETREQTQMPKSLIALGDDPLRAALSFLSVSECRRSVGATAKHFRALAASTALARTRFSDRYVLRGDRHGVVHFLATAGGTRAWPSRQVRFDSSGPHNDWKVVAAPPAALQITSHREHTMSDPHLRAQEDSMLCFESACVDSVSDVCLAYLTECCVGAGSLVEYKLPFELRVRRFRLGFGSCYSQYFDDWVFEAFDAEREEWRGLYYCDESPWVNRQEDETFVREEPIDFPAGASFGSSRFRIRLTERTDETLDHQCMHIRGFELFGAILPPWRMDV